MVFLKIREGGWVLKQKKNWPIFGEHVQELYASEPPHI